MNYKYRVIPKENSIISKPFFGYIINQAADNLYFKIDSPCGPLIIMPHEDIKYMYPINYKKYGD